jgi:hypothetical protein
MCRFTAYCVCLVLISVFAAPLAAASKTTPFAGSVQDVTFTRQDHHYLLSATLNYSLNDTAKEALHNGVPLFWQVVIKVIEQRPLLWDETVIKLKLRYRLQYHALLNMYRVTNENADSVDNFSTLAAALNAMSRLRNLPIVPTNAIHAEQSYSLALKINFDRDALPLPLQPLALFSPQWYFVSDWSAWAISN